MADQSPYTTPRWVKVFGIIALILILLVVIIMFTGVGGPHGPGRHLPSGDADGDTPPSSVIEDSTPSTGPDDSTPPIEHGMQQP
ncbi:MAG: hypothetical protein DPW09_08305 [Anaerolineae bacterium]|nr:hypothetical protein [Anaerolineae bacterium]